jgi:predicted permease
MLIDYVRAVQIAAVTFTIMLFGFLAALFKLFTYKEIRAIRRLMTFVAVPALVFRVIGDSSFGFSIFLPLFHSLLTQATVHVLLIVASCFRPRNRIEFILRHSLLLARPNYIYIGYPLLQVLFPDVLCAVAMVAAPHFLVLGPLSAFLRAPPESPTTEDDATADNSPGGADSHENPILDDLPHRPSDDVLADINQPLNTSSERLPPPPWRRALLALASPVCIAFVLGIAWAATPWNMLRFMTVFVGDLERAVVASGLFAAGVFCRENRWAGSTEKAAVILTILVHAIGMPILAGGWCFALGIGGDVAKAIVLMNAAPMAWSALVDADDADAAPFAFVWGSVLAMPVTMMWVAVLNFSHLFE